MALPVIPRVKVPRMPDPPVRELNLKTVSTYYNARVLAEVKVCGTDETVALIDKAFPHSRFDVMLLVSNDEVHSSVTDVDDSTASVVWALASEFRRYLRRPDIRARFDLAGCELHQCFNFSRDTVDRENGQFYDKRFHLHMNCWPERDLRDLTAVPFGAIDNATTRRRMMDPLTYLGPRIMYDLLASRVEGYQVLPVDVDEDIRRRLPPGFKVRLDGWDSLREPRFARLLRRLHLSADSAYRALFRAITGQAHAPRAWHRENLLDLPAIEENLKRIPWLGEQTRRLVCELASGLREVSAQEMHAFRADHGLASRYLAMAGLDYSIGLCSSPSGQSDVPAEDEQAYVVMQFRLLGEVGSASLPPLRNACMALLDRQDGPVMSDEDLHDRQEFIGGFLLDALPKLEASRLAVPLSERSS
jgi:hypothetical protein